MKLDNRLTFLIVGVLAVAAIAGGWLIGIQPQLAAASASDTSLAQAQDQNGVTQAQVASLRTAKTKLPTLEAQLAALKLAVPDGVDGSALLAAVSGMASATGASVQTFNLAAPTAYNPPAAPAAAAAPASGTTSGSTTPSTSAAPAAAAVTGLTPYTDAGISAGNFAVMAFSTSATAGGSQQLLDFVQALQSGSRLFLVTGVELAAPAPGQKGQYTVTVSGNVYMTLGTTAAATATAGATATPTPTATATPTPSATPSPSGSASPTPAPSSTPTKKP